MAQNVISQRSWPWKVKVIGQNKWHHEIYWPWKHISRCQNHHPMCLTFKVMVKDVILHNGGQRNAFAYVSRSNRSRYFWFVESPRPKLPCVKIWWRFVQQEPRYGPKCDFTHLWPWKVKVKHEVNKILHWNAHTTHEYTCEVSLKSYGQLFRYGEQIVARRKKERRRIKRNSLTDVDILWRKLRHEGEIWRKSDQHVIWRSFPELSFGISWGSIHWAVIEIEPPTLRLKSWELLY